MPTSAAMAWAVASLSPVIMTTVKPLVFHGGNRFFGPFFDGVGHADDGAGLAINGQPHGGFGFVLQLARLWLPDR